MRMWLLSLEYMGQGIFFRTAIITPFDALIANRIIANLGRMPRVQQDVLIAYRCIKEWPISEKNQDYESGPSRVLRGKYE